MFWIFEARECRPMLPAFISTSPSGPSSPSSPRQSKQRSYCKSSSFAIRTTDMRTRTFWWTQSLDDCWPSFIGASLYSDVLRPFFVLSGGLKTWSDVICLKNCHYGVWHWVHRCERLQNCMIDEYHIFKSDRDLIDSERSISPVNDINIEYIKMTI